MRKIYTLTVALLIFCGEFVTGQTNTPGTSTAIPGWYYKNTTGLTCAALKTALKNRISDSTVVLSYTPGVWNAFSTTDLHRNDANTANVIWDMYSDNPTGPEAFYFTQGTDQCGTYSVQGDCYNREHSFPQAWFGAGTFPMFSDLHHVFATDGFTNGKHDNNPYSEVGTTSWTSTNGSKLGTNTFPGFTGTVFEPINEYKGDFARAMLYMVTRYEDDMVAWKNNGNADDILSGNTYPSLDNWYIKLCYKWHLQDPVSAKEIARNDAIYALQKNRNPFIDRPEFVNLIWQCTGLLPVSLIDFTGTKQANAIKLQWTATRELNFKQYEIERSTDGVSFNKIATITAQNLGNYNALDNNLPNTKNVFYRLKLVDIDGAFTYSKIVNIKLFNSNGAIIFPNPATNNLNIKLQQPLIGNCNISIFDAIGKKILFKKLLGTQNFISLSINQLSAGNYVIQIQTDKELIQDSFIKVK
jgi:endonuclease I